MKAIRQFFNLLRESFSSLWRNKTMSFTSVISITAMLTLFGVVILMILNINGMVYQTGEKLDKVVFFLKDDVNPKDVNEFIDELDGNKKVKKVSYVSKEEALEEFKEGFGENSTILENIPGGNPLPASITVEMKELSYGKEIEDKYKDLPIVEDHNYYYDFVTQMMKLQNGVKYVGAAIVLILVLISILIIHNTIKIAISNMEKEINIMKYVGATNTYIRGPFLINGIIFGILGSALSGFLTLRLYGIIFDRLNPQLNEITGVDMISALSVRTDLYIMFLCIGVGIGFFGSLFSTKKFLDV
ncbi:Cell division protein FtsX [Peptoniphilus harei]|uniref:Cell division protein FtsX n=1 Tax=Peptoniphilus harei TaxID=54005 RepID=A0A943Y0N1_9FIRM|nr:permease-like cell division protein FtsX [Peptoniphilus harei]MBS6535548.1 permease-like cell division protein FtsX [Peptoniphilus harei]MDU5470699.1 permease-like cell division protein FtsX [Peptoniphilus harei]MDU6098091.1 permease-like cell division protein FtsX [Peptoniphilus harei]QQE46203.1 ABC transporter permease [Peptoniphilus harei]VEJ33676.1 Cell division protein FtsX [Peptoniphilus harei]